MLGPNPVSIYMKAKQDDYWNKITQYNTKLHELEQKDIVNKKKTDQQKMRDMLAEQLAGQQNTSN
jgi:hypothetical protein